jgi:hypothetical protein
MKRPSWASNPKWLAVLLFGTGVTCGGWLFAKWLAGTWVPSGEDAVRAACGLVSALLLTLLDYIQYRLSGDEYIRAMSSYKPGSSYRGSALTARPRWYRVSYYALFMAALICLQGRHGPSLAAITGLLIGYSLGYWHWRAVWKHKWELYELDQQQAVTPTVPGETPTP